MTVNKIFTNFLDDLVQAQYNSYLYSQSLGEQEDILLPIPFAEIKEITLDLNYAYDATAANVAPFRYDLGTLKSEALKLWQAQLKKLLKVLVEKIEENGIVHLEEWTAIKKGIYAAEYHSYLAEAYTQEFHKTLAPIIQNSNDTQQELEPLSWSKVLRMLEIHMLEKEILNHKDLLNWLTPRIHQALITDFKEDQSKDDACWSIHFNLAKKLIPPPLNIIVDAEQLKNLPPEAIQKAKVVMRMKNITLEP